MLIADDERLIRLAIRRYFGDLGWRVDEAATAREALSLLAEHSFDVVVADLRFDPEPATAGFDLVRAVRRLRPECCIVMLTAYGDDAVLQQAWDTGVHVFAVKPVPLPRLRELIEANLPERVMA